MKCLKPLKLPVIAVFSVLVLVLAQIAFAVNVDLSLTVDEGVLYIDVVDAGGLPVPTPTFTFTNKAFSFDAQDFSGVLGTATQKFRLSNPTAEETWTVSIAAGNVTDVWTDGTYTFAFNDATADNGRLSLDPSVSTIAGVNGCVTTNISKGSAAYFLNGTTNSIDLMTAGIGTVVACRWDLTGVGMTQRLPAAQPPSTYSLGLIVTAL